MSKLLELLDVIRTDPDVASATLVIWSIILGIIIALLVSFYNRRVLGSFFRALIKAGAQDAESAKTLAEINQTENDAIIKKLRRGQYTDVVTIVNESEETKDNVVINENTKFYLEESKFARVRDQWGESDENIWVLIGGIVGIVILGVLVTVLVSTTIFSA
ncbi:MAG: hypothetical protein E7608_00720 [Ruminococcaceae bacterium]|nr:hypothetical protein [Oscillospiraceae bacterium]